MRCLALAQACQDAGGAADFLSVELPAALEARLRDEKFGVHRMRAIPGSRADAEATVQAARENEATWIVADGYDFGDDFQTVIKQSGARLLVVDDTGHLGRYRADVVLNQNPQAAESMYPQLAPGTDLLLGSRYAMLRREFLPWRNRQREREPARRLLITLGGADPNNATLKVMRAFQLLRWTNIEAVVLVGPANPHLVELEAAARAMKCPVEIKVSAPNVPELMDWADGAISAAGSTCWELAFMGVPSLLIVLAENQRSGAEALQSLGVSRNLGWYADLGHEAIAAELEGFLQAKESRGSMSARGRSLIDGGGAARVVEELHRRTLTLQRASEKDGDLLFRWANEPEVRRVSFSSEPISKEDHMRWFSAKIRDPQVLLYIASDAAGAPAGQIRFDLEGSEATVSVSVAPDRRGAGLGRQLIRRGVEMVFRETSVLTIHAFIKPDNERSMASFEGAGFANSGHATVKGHVAAHLLRHAEQMALAGACS